MRRLGAWLLLVLGLLCGLCGWVAAEPIGSSRLLPALSTGVPCGLLGECARFDALGIHLGGTFGIEQSRSQGLLLAGRTRVSVSMLDALDVSLSFGAQHLREHSESAPSVEANPLAIAVRLRLWPWFDRSGPDLALGITQTVPSRWLGSAGAVPQTIVSLAGSKRWRRLELDGSGGLLWTDGRAKPDGLRLSASLFFRLYQTHDPTLPRDSYRVGLQASALFPVVSTAFPASTTSLAVFEAVTDRGFRFHLGMGAATEGRLLGGVALVQLLGSWGLRYRTSDSRAGALGGMPDWYLDWFMVDPILEADGCIYTDPSSIGRIKIICVGTPDPIDSGTIVHNDGRRFPVGLHVWIDKIDGTLMTEDRQILAKPDEKTAKLAIVVQQLAELVKRREQKTGTQCFLRGGTLHTVQSPAFAATLAQDELGGGASLLGYELARMIFCGGEPLAGGIPPLLPFSKQLGGALRSGNQKVADLIEHEKPAATPSSAAPSAPARPQPITAEPASILNDQSRKHIFNGEVKAKGNRATGWHYEPTGDKNKGTLVIDGTRSQPDPSGVYQGEVMVEGVRKSARTSFFPKDWNEKQVESAIEEAYKNKRPSEKADGFVGKTASGIEVEMFLDQKGSIDTAYPLFKGSAATKGK